MTFVFQPPGTARLLEAIDAAAENSFKGGGVFAFASKSGIEAFFACPNILSMLSENRPVHLIVGIDAITNAEALLCLSEKIEQFPDALTANVFFHEQPNSTFHPKFSWFQHETSLRLITGSGNLTLRGLGQVVPLSGNWEAFSIQNFEGADAQSAIQEIEGWINEQHAQGSLCSMEDVRVREKAMKNGLVRFVAKPTRSSATASPEQAITETPEVGALAQPILSEREQDRYEILIRELPKNRPGQGDVGKNVHENFFGYEGVDKTILLQHVSLDNELKTVLPVWLFFNPASANYRLELSAMDGVRYEDEISSDDGRIIIVATKLDSRSFRYTLLLPISTPEHYEKVSALLGPIRGGRRLMREKFVSPEALSTAWPEAPSNLLPVIIPTPEP